MDLVINLHFKILEILIQNLTVNLFQIKQILSKTKLWNKIKDKELFK